MYVSIKKLSICRPKAKKREGERERERERERREKEGERRNLKFVKFSILLIIAAILI